jgi:hypothetical protein
MTLSTLAQNGSRDLRWSNNLKEGRFKIVASLFNAKLPSGLNEPLGLRLVCELGFRFGFGLIPWPWLFGHNAAFP